MAGHKNPCSMQTFNKEKGLAIMNCKFNMDFLVHKFKNKWKNSEEYPKFISRRAIKNVLYIYIYISLSNLYKRSYEINEGMRWKEISWDSIIVH